MQSKFLVRKGVVAAIILAVSVGCDEPTSIGALKPGSSIGRVAGDTIMTLTDTTDGYSYTLNLVRRTVRRSDGETMLLDGEQYLMTHATFEGIVASDPLAADLLAGGTVDCSTLPPDDPRCVDPQMVAPGGGDAEVAYSGGDICTNIVDIGIARANAYRSSKWTWLRSAFGAAGAEFINGAFYKVMPAGSAVAAAFATEVANHYQNRIQMGVLGAFWNSYNCDSKRVTSSPVYTNGEPGTEAEILQCDDVQDRISFDDGESWHSVWVRICRFKTT